MVPQIQQRMVNESALTVIQLNIYSLNKLLGSNSLYECFLKAGPYGGLSSEELQVKKKV